MTQSKVGKVFKNGNITSIKKEDIPKTISWISAVTGLSEDTLNNNLLGSAGKAKVSGDLDIAIDPDDAKAVYSRLISNLSADAVKMNNGLKQIHFLAPIGDSEDYVQTDLMFGGDPELLKFTTASGGDKDYPYKGKDRAHLLATLVKKELADYVVKDGDVTVARAGYVMINAQGLVYQYRVLRKTKTGDYKKKMDHVTFDEFVNLYPDCGLKRKDGVIYDARNEAVKDVINTKDEIVEEIFGPAFFHNQDKNPLDGYKDVARAITDYLGTDVLKEVETNMERQR